ncbi:hypothetical protein L1280_003103 [Deinococcus sp. HSC-46F16]|uniref:hypothetical protein n=1 Tax=Deinococcus sp. HSC-46F16 TaxID=2910968 RepID=UPI00209DEE42|nr:hypothetical protein [Deinococcus sp. HSC-46F16]MCP2015920.1 hypothetical protein [Deinococcus sp. HSC-46F16]
MPVESSIWKLGQTVEKVPFIPLALESKLQAALEQNLEIPDPGLMLVGRQVRTENNKFIDLLAVDSEGHLHVIELKRGLTPRDVVAQALDYAAWVRKLGREDVQRIYAENHDGKGFDDGFRDSFDAALPETLNASHQLTIVASDIDPSTERIVQYLVDYGVPINVVFFRHFAVGQDEFLVRTWLIDPDEAAEQVERRDSQKKQQPWNGQDYYVVFGESTLRHWDDAVRYGFLSAGKGRKYSRTLEALQPGRRVSAYIPRVGYVGVGTVTTVATPIKDFVFKVGGDVRPVSSLPFSAPEALHDFDDPELSEWLVGVEWQQTVPKSDALTGSSLFSNQYIVCRLRDQGTLEALAKHFPQAFQEDSA